MERLGNFYKYLDSLEPMQIFGYLVIIGFVVITIQIRLTKPENDER